MAYFNYHAKIKKKILEGKLQRYEIVQNWNGICPALVFYFFDGPPMPVREYKFQEYFEFLNELKL